METAFENSEEPFVMIWHRHSTSGILIVATLAVCFGSCSQDPRTTAAATLPSSERLGAVRGYIRGGWQTLTRSHADLLEAIDDPKIAHDPASPRVLYISSQEDPEAVRRELSRSLSPDELDGVSVRQLPGEPIERSDEIDPHGLLYLPHPYVVPGGRFNEMYGWDSYFIQLGLLRDGKVELARNMTANFLYQIEHYGTILNANRSYYLTRSQPPFLTAMILGVFEVTKDLEWLENTLPQIEDHYSFWTSPPRGIDHIGLSRFHALGEGPAPEVVMGERDADGRTHYDRVREYYRDHRVLAYDESSYYDPDADQLTAQFYVGDRSMRESGFDPSNRFGPFSVDIVHYAPVCLNSLLVKMEQDTARILTLLGRQRQAAVWTDRARARAEAVNRRMWDDDAGIYRDYRFSDDTLSDYEFATTFYPLWVGIASEQQARRIRDSLDRFEAPGGVVTSTVVSGSQWDAPFGWAPLQLIAVKALRRYGFHDDADRLSIKFIELVTKEFEQHGVILEKYDVVARESETADGVRFGYSTNVIGFGWTNGVFLELLADLETRPE